VVVPQPGWSPKQPTTEVAGIRARRSDQAEAFSVAKRWIKVGQGVWAAAAVVALRGAEAGMSTEYVVLGDITGVEPEDSGFQWIVCSRGSVVGLRGARCGRVSMRRTSPAVA